MAMVIANNNVAMLALGEVNRNSKALGKQLKKVSSGMRMSGAGEDAANYAISEKMRVQIRGLEQDIRNTQTGVSLLKVAEGGVQGIIEELRTLKELALNSVNDHNTDLDRATLQKEFDARRANIDEIATETNYNGKPLLDGTYKRVAWHTEEVSGYDSAEATQIARGDYEITTGGVYELAADYSGTLTVSAPDVILRGTAAMQEVYIVDNGAEKIYLRNINITNSQDRSAIAFSGSNNTLYLLGNNSITATGLDEKACINAGGGLTIAGKGTLDVAATFEFAPESAPNPGSADCGAVIGSDAEGTCGNITVGTGATVKATSTLTIPDNLDYVSFNAVIGSGAGGTCGDISIASGATVTAKHLNRDSTGASIGSGGCSTRTGALKFAHCGDITIYSEASVTAGRTDYAYSSLDFAGVAIGSGWMGNTCGDITVYTGANVKAVTISDMDDTLIWGGFGTSGGGEESCGNITIYAPGANGNVTASRIGKLFVDETVGAISIGTGVVFSEVCNNNMTSTYAEVGEKVATLYTPYEDTDESTVTVRKEAIGDPLVIHHGTKANQALNVYLEDMHTNMLKGEVPNGEDAAQLAKLVEPELSALQAVLEEAKDKSLADISVNPQQSAVVSIRVVDGAIQYALDQATTIGAYISQLGFTESNLVTAHASVTASESTIRDADMAREMTEYTKANVLLQAAQSMLAQSNQNISNVLSLLQ